MTTKLNTAKIGGLLLAVASLAMIYIVFTIKIGSGKVENSSYPVDQESSANNITMKLISAHTEGSGYRVEVCYNLPDQRDWLLTYPSASLDTTLSVADIKVKPVDEGTMYWKYDQNGKIAQRCQYLYFVLHIPSQKENISLKIGKLYARELGQSDYCLEVSQKMVEKSYAVTIDCMKVNNLEGLVYVKFPVELLSMDPVFKGIFKEIKWDEYDGPWLFTFPVNPH